MLAKYTYICYYIVTGKKESPGEVENGTRKREELIMESAKMIELETTAASLYDGGWRAADREELKGEYGFTDEELEVVTEKLKEYEER